MFIIILKIIFVLWLVCNIATLESKVTRLEKERDDAKRIGDYL